MSKAPDILITNKSGTAIITPPAIPLHQTDIEWIRKDVADALLKAEREKALREAAGVARAWKDCGHDFDVEAEVIALISEDKTDG